MRILVAGAAGFIGWNLTRELRRRHPDADIVGVDNLWTGIRRREEYCTEFHVSDICEWLDFGPRFDYIYHLASPASPIHYQSRPLRTIKSNVDGLWWVLERHLRPAGGTIFFASSSEVYGDPLVSPQPESYKGYVNCVGPRACYDESKRLCETIMTEWARAHPQQRCKIARLFNVYGPGTLPSDGRCMSNFIWDAMHGRPITIYGSGKQTRCFTYVDNVVKAIVDLTELQEPRLTGPINIGTNVETCVRDMAVAVLQEVAKWRKARGMSELLPKPEFLPAVADDPQQRLPDLTLAGKILGWDARRLIPYHGATGGIQRTIKYFESEWWDESETDSDKPSEAAAPPAGDAGEPARAAVRSGGAVGPRVPG